jgi:hypothetical protein
MSALHELQRAFAAAMVLEHEAAVREHIVEEDFSPAERLRIYRNTFRSTLTEALRMTYPAVDRVVGRDFFDAAAEQFIQASPPSSAYLNEYGGGFGDFLAQFEPARGLAYLSDLARFEWALNAAANAVDMPALHAEALAVIDTEHHDKLQFEPHSSVRFLALDYAADEIADAVLSGDDAAMAEVDVSQRAAWLVVHRGPNGVEAQPLDSEACAFLSRLCDGEPLGRLLEHAPAEAPALIAEQFTKGRLTGFRIGRPFS